MRRTIGGFSGVVTIAGLIFASLCNAQANSPSISPPSGTLPTGQINQVYSQTLTASGGSGNYSWSITNQSPGLNLSVNPASGVTVSLSGTPTTANTDPGLTVTVMVTDTTSMLTEQQTYTIPVSTGAGSVTIGVSSNEGNCYPYSCGYSDGLTEWQQHFLASAFGVAYVEFCPRKRPDLFDQ